MPKVRKGFSILLLTIFFGIVIVGGGLFYYYKTFMPKTGWKKISGCVASSGVNYNYQFFGKENWYSVTGNMGCGKSYQDAESWGLKDQTITGETKDVAQVTVLLTNTKPASVDSSAFNYFNVPNKDDLFLELGKISVYAGTDNFIVTDEEWQYIQKSFRFKK